jgi:Bacterial DNA-binding protein
VLVVRELKKEGSIRLAGFGILRKRTGEPRLGRNPITGEQIKTSARTRLRFAPTKALKGRGARRQLSSGGNRPQPINRACSLANLKLILNDLNAYRGYCRDIGLAQPI